jgi:two-component system OmpR family response regulator
MIVVFMETPPMKQGVPLLDDMAILALTRDGEHELREPGTTLSPSQLEALVLIGGRATVAQVLKRAHDMAPDVLRANLTELIDKNLVSVNAGLGGDVIDAGDFFTLGTASTATPEEGVQPHDESGVDAEFLRQNGYYVNMARRQAVKPNRAEGRKLTVLAIEDDPDISKLLQICLKLEGFDTRTAGNRDEVVAAFRLLPLPDLVLLDVRLPDINGFDILAKMRQHQVLKEVPVIMLTAAATREAVLRGIQGGADGFITKPFQIDHLVKAVKMVLGLEDDSNG